MVGQPTWVDNARARGPAVTVVSLEGASRD